MTILVACGLQREANILRGLGVIAIPGGGDAVRLEAVLDGQAAGATIIVSAGIAGALDPALTAGDVVIHQPPFVSSEVEKQATSVARGVSTSLDTNGWGEELRAALPHARYGQIIGQDHIAATAAEKAALYAATGALAVDMESHIAARVAARHGLPFIAMRTISDTAHESLPPAALVGMSPDGSMALGKVLTSLARRPGQLPALIKTGQNAEAAFRALRQVSHAIAALNRP
ncbi:phosphorylase [Sphingomonas sp. 28-62-11]|uniref:phosphorylase family protein n=1 Tax=Sphingomonas sp. 28-62-11 TaxID=1970432 RepID=UPI000BDC263E|nr:MAG: phosphorylase [Sphingomonas sp. 28-62-11]